jgi:hypothetical protein
MLLNHYVAMLEQYMQGKLASFINAQGVTCTFSNMEYQANESPLPLVAHQGAQIMVGGDNTPETGDSYKLKKELSYASIGLNVALTRSVVDNDDGSHSSVVVAVCTNTSTEPITLGEIGIRDNYQTASSASQTVYIDRTPLGTPLTIQPGEVGRIVYTITMA